MTSYHVEYEGYYTMWWHDREENALKRWFDNYKIDRYASFAIDYEWLIVKEVPSDTRHCKPRFICEIGDDGRDTKREVIMDHTAPIAPVLTFAAKRHYEPPPPKTEQQIRKEAEWNRMHELGYEPVRRLIYKPAVSFLKLDNFAAAATHIAEVEYEIEWVQRHTQRSFERPNFQLKVPPKAPTHKRNV
jgi:hypothetical protein